MSTEVFRLSDLSEPPISMGIIICGIFPLCQTRDLRSTQSVLVKENGRRSQSGE